MGPTKRRVEASSSGPDPGQPRPRTRRHALDFLGRAHRRRRKGPKPGSAPGVLADAPDAVETNGFVMFYDAARLEEREVSILEVGPPPHDAPGVMWFDVERCADHAALEGIRERFGIHPLALADVVNIPQRPKAEEYEGHLLVVTQMVSLGPGGEIEIEQVSLVLGPNWLITFQECPGDVFDPVRERLRASSKIRQFGADYLAYALIDAIVDGFFPVVESIGEVLEQLEDEVVSGPTATTLAQIHGVRHVLLNLNRIQRRQRDAIASLLRDANSPFSPPVQVYLRDAHDHALQTLDAIETYRDMAISLMDVYLSIASNRMNEIMKTLTVMASIFIPLTFIVGVYGMNFDYMPELRWHWGYPAVWLVMLAIAGGLLAWFRGRGWIGKD